MSNARMATINWTDGMAEKSAPTSRWIAFPRGLHAAVLGAIAAWWALWDVQRHSALVSKLAVRDFLLSFDLLKFGIFLKLNPNPRPPEASLVFDQKLSTTVQSIGALPP
jgi:hypothetical protein